MTRPVGKMTMLALAFSGFTSLTACSPRGEDDRPAADDRDTTGSASFALRLADGRTIQTVSYTITGPKGFVKTGTVDVSGSTKLAATIGGLPVGTGFDIALSAITSDGSASCAGSGKFDVLGGKTASVVVALTCHEAPRTGSVRAETPPR